MPHVIDTNTGYCETHRQFEYTVLEAGRANPVFSGGGGSYNNYANENVLADSSATAVNPNLFQIKFYPDNTESSVYTQPIPAKTKIYPQRLLIENEVILLYSLSSEFELICISE